jgi:hypothetical protein
MPQVGANVVTNVLLRVRAQDFMLMGDWSVLIPTQAWPREGGFGKAKRGDPEYTTYEGPAMEHVYQEWGFSPRF